MRLVPQRRTTIAIALLTLGALMPALHAQAAAPPAARVTVRQLAGLRWLAGDWRGTGTAGTSQDPFFERYRFVDDSTLVVDSFADSTWGTVTESARYELRGGRLGNTGSRARWVATRVGRWRAEFAPVAGARNGFRWERATSGGARPREWRATIMATGRDGQPTRRDYRMQRIR